MSLKIAEIPYLNCSPFYWDKESQRKINRPKRKNFIWIPVSPKMMGQYAREGEIDAGPISLEDSFDLEKDFEPLSDLGIAVKKSAKSVLLFSKKQISSLAGCDIGVTPDTVTSLELLKFILEGKYGIEAKYQKGFDRANDAQLRIGDEALKEILRNGTGNHFKFVYDLGEEWHKWQNLPFVFARWMIRKTVNRTAKTQLSEMLIRNLNKSAKQRKLALNYFEQKSGWHYPQAQRYLKGFQYRLKEKEKEAILVFKRLRLGFAATVCGC